MTLPKIYLNNSLYIDGKSLSNVIDSELDSTTTFQDIVDIILASKQSLVNNLLARNIQCDTTYTLIDLINLVSAIDQHLAIPTNLNASFDGTQTVTLTWDDNSDNELGFKVYQKVPGGSFLLNKTLETPSIVTTDIDLGSDPVNGTYEYYITAYNATYESDASNTTTVDVSTQAYGQVVLNDFTTTDTNPEGVVLSGATPYTTYYRHNAMNSDLTTTSTGYFRTTNADATNTGLVISLPIAKICNHIKVYIPASYGAILDHKSTIIYLDGSNNGIDWTNVYANESNLFNTEGAWNTRTFVNSTKYSYYRYRFGSIQANARLTEIELWYNA